MNQLEVKSRIDSPPDDVELIVTEMLVDGRPLTDFRGRSLSVDLFALERSIRQSGEFFIVTCLCGVPACAGIKQGIQVRHSETNTHWIVRGLGETQTFYFDGQEYEVAIRRGIRHLQQMMEHHRLGIAPKMNERIFGRSNGTR